MIRRTNLNRWLIISLFLAGFAPAVAVGGTIYVDADAGGANNGSSWGDAYNYLQDGLAVAGDGNEIWVAVGTYKPDEGGGETPNDRTATFQLITGVAIYGGFAGSETGLEERDWVTNETILSGDVGTGVDDSYHVVTSSGTYETTVLDGFTITAGNAMGTAWNNYGGGMFNETSSPTVTNCTFSGNFANGQGGGMYNLSSSDLTVTNCTFSGNEATNGGGMYNWNSSPTVTNCTFTGNEVFGGSGGMCNYNSSSPTVTNCIFWDNSGTQISPGSLNVTYNNVQGGYSGTGNINADPLFVDAAGGDLRLSTGSPCIDAGDNTAVPGGVTTDLDGNPRFDDDPVTPDTGSGTPPIVDMGVYEYSSIHVDESAAPGGDGASWATAYKYLQDGLTDAATSGKSIAVAEGTYYPDEDEGGNVTGGARAETFDLINGVSIVGGYQTGGTGVRNVDTYITTLSGNIGSAGTDTDNSYHVVTGSGTEPNAVLDGFTITAGNADGGGLNDRGGGMWNYFGSPTVTSCAFSGNSADFGGGMSNTNSSSPTVINCTFSGNAGNFYGGGMYNNSGSPTVTNCTFSGNSTNTHGGGMYNELSSPELVNCTFSGNSALNFGGGMSNWNDSSPTVTNCILWGNTASSGTQIYDDGMSSTTVSYSDVQGGWAGATNIAEDPLFKDADNLSLSFGSPCIDAGDNNSVPADTADLDNDANTSERTPLDLAGNARFTNDPVVVDTGNPPGADAIVEMGAYERYEFCGSETYPHPPGDVSGPDGFPDCYLDFYDFAVWAAHWLEYTGPE